MLAARHFIARPVAARAAARRAASSRAAAVTVQAREAKWSPGSEAPAHLDGSMPGDFGFDPLYLGEDKEQLEWYRNAELIHGRFAMLGTAGILFTDGLTTSGAYDLPAWTDVQTQTFSVADTWTLFLVQMLLFSVPEHKRLYDLKNPGSQGAAGSFFGLEGALGGSGVAGYPGKAFDPLGLAKPGPEFEELKVKEIKNGRLAMMAFLGICAQTYSTGAGPHANLVAHVADPWHTTFASNTVAIPRVLEFTQA